MSKSPKSPFNLASGAWGQEKADQHDQNQGPDKDNAAQRFDPPNQNQKPAPNLAPPGMSGGSGGAKKGHEDNDHDRDGSEPTVFEFVLDTEANRKVDVTEHPTTTKIALPDGQNTAYIDHSFEKDPNGGEDIGKISRLSIADENQNGVEFKNGKWIKEPQTSEEHARVNKLTDQFGPLDEQKFKSFEDINPDQENSRDI